MKSIFLTQTFQASWYASMPSFLNVFQKWICMGIFMLVLLVPSQAQFAVPVCEVVNSVTIGPHPLQSIGASNFQWTTNSTQVSFSCATCRNTNVSTTLPTPVTAVVSVSFSGPRGPGSITYSITLNAADNDNDGWGDCFDCNDNDATRYPGAPEICDGTDYDCDGQTCCAPYPTVTSISGPTGGICPGGSATLTVNGNLGQATGWNWYSNGCGSFYVGSGQSITVSPTSNTTYYVSGEGGCVGTGGSCHSFQVQIVPSSLNVQTKDITLSLQNGTTSQTITPAMIDDGSTSVCGIVDMWTSPSTLDCSNLGINTVTLYAEDGGGNVSSGTAQVTLNDIEPPVARARASTLDLDGNGFGLAQPFIFENGSTDNCGIVNSEVTPNTFSCADIGVNTISYTVWDASGNSHTTTTTLTISDRFPPLISTRNHTVSLDASNQASITAADVTAWIYEVCGLATTSVSPNTFTCADLGPNTVTLTAVDIYGNVGTETAIVTVVDPISPVAIATPITVDLDPNGPTPIPAATLGAASTDNCGIATYEVIPPTVDCGDVGIKSVTLRVIDASGNMAETPTTVTVRDLNPPTAIALATQSLILDASGIATLAPSQFDNGSTDDCGIDFMTVSPATVSCADIGSKLTVTLTVTDMNGNTANATTQVIVADNSAPTVVTQPVTVTPVFPGTVVITPAMVDGGSTDNCGVDSMWVVPDTYTCADLGAQTSMLYVRDVNGLTAGAPVSIQIDEPPLAFSYFPPDMTVSADPQTCDAMVSYFMPRWADPCGNFSFSLTAGQYPLSRFPVGVSTVTFMLDDGNGNTVSQSLTITVVDDTPPVLDCPADIYATAAPGQTSAVVNYRLPKVNDPCPGTTIAFHSGLGSGAAFPVGKHWETLIATDAAGNTTTCTFTVVVQASASKSRREAVAEIEVEKEAFLYPNPVEDHLNIVLSGFETHPVWFVMYDHAGRHVMSRQWKVEGSLKEQVNLSSLASGLYFYKIKVGTFSKEGKIVKR